jgi:hypothetical protein
MNFSSRRGDKEVIEKKHDPNLPYNSLKNQMAEISIRYMKIRPTPFIPDAPRDIFIMPVISVLRNYQIGDQISLCFIIFYL